MLDEAFLLGFVGLPRVELDCLEEAALWFCVDLPVFAGFLVFVISVFIVAGSGSIVIEVYISVVEGFGIYVLPKKGSQVATFGGGLRSQLIKDISLGYQHLIVVIYPLVEGVGIANRGIRMASD